jgi:2-polyprenyl-3-methyl-5-hydroxy-6-metoxy-1,4-benzoquinol methylase
VSPRLNPDGRTALYGEADYFDEGVYRTASASRLQRIWTEGRLDTVATALPGQKDRRLFEIGCAYGVFLEAAQDHGMTVGGLEYSQVAAVTAGERLSMDIYVGEVTDLPASEDQDAVVFWDVIEHVPDPARFLASVAGLVRPGGVVAFSCPYFDSIPARVLRRGWWTLKPHKHIWHFRRQDLAGLVADVGLEVVSMTANPLRRANLGRLDSLVMVARRPARGEAVRDARERLLGAQQPGGRDQMLPIWARPRPDGPYPIGW